MKPAFFNILQKDRKTRARTGVIHTPHGDIQTPAFVPVGTQATVKSLTPEELDTLGVQLFFVNTYHVYLRPGVDVIKKFGGLHKFIGWHGPIVTDSGGFQLFSLARQKFALRNKNEKDDPELVKITDDGVMFRSHWDGNLHTFTPEKSIEIQHALRADMILTFDDCTPYPVTHAQAECSMERTHRWTARSVEAHEKFENINYKLQNTQTLYGVVQGSVFEDLRKESARFISSLNFDGIAIGGVSVGESKEEMQRVLGWVVPVLPQQKPRHLLGVGEIDDIFTLVEQGIDTFDCVQPTRLARMGHVFTNSKLKTQISKLKDTSPRFTIDLTKTQYAKDILPIDESCRCYTCEHFSRAYLRHLFHVRELLAYRLATVHNIFFVNDVIQSIRRAIRSGSFYELKREWLDRYNNTRQ